eukprot:gene4323-14436_t
MRFDNPEASEVQREQSEVQGDNPRDGSFRALSIRPAASELQRQLSEVRHDNPRDTTFRGLRMSPDRSEASEVQHSRGAGVQRRNSGAGVGGVQPMSICLDIPETCHVQRRISRTFSENVRICRQYNWYKQCMTAKAMQGEWLSPCLCMGSSKFVHRTCLLTWLEVAPIASRDECSSCKYKYRLEAIDTPLRKFIRAKPTAHCFLVPTWVLLILVLGFVTVPWWLGGPTMAPPDDDLAGKAIPAEWANGWGQGAEFEPAVQSPPAGGSTEVPGVKQWGAHVLDGAYLTGLCGVFVFLLYFFSWHTVVQRIRSVSPMAMKKTLVACLGIYFMHSKLSALAQATPIVGTIITSLTDLERSDLLRERQVLQRGRQLEREREKDQEWERELAEGEREAAEAVANGSHSDSDLTLRHLYP